MLNNLMALSANLLNTASNQYASTLPIGEVAIYAVLGYLVVFVGIAFLIFIVWAVGQLVSKVNGKSFSLKKKVKKQVEQPIAVQAVSDELDDETVAVIMAALMAYYQQTNAKCDFTVKRIKRI